jgi:hypothetical protein
MKKSPRLVNVATGIVFPNVPTEFQVPYTSYNLSGRTIKREGRSWSSTATLSTKIFSRGNAGLILVSTAAQSPGLMLPRSARTTTIQTTTNCGCPTFSSLVLERVGFLRFGFSLANLFLGLVRHHRAAFHHPFHL